MLQRVGLAAGIRSTVHVEKIMHVNTHKHISVKYTVRRWLATCAAYRLAGKHIIACSHLTCQNSRAPCLLIFGFSGFELLEIK